MHTEPSLDTADPFRRLQKLGGSAGLVDVPADQLPPGVSALLRHEDGMTAALERHWGERMTLTVRRSERVGGRLLREVVLAGAERGLPAELGLIDIDLTALPPPIAAEVIAARRPFGALLASAGIGFRSRPVRFFRIPAYPVLAEVLRVPVDTLLYGRETRLADEAARPLAEAVEILAPVVT